MRVSELLDASPPKAERVMCSLHDPYSTNNSTRFFKSVNRRSYQLRKKILLAPPNFIFGGQRKSQIGKLQLKVMTDRAVLTSLAGVMLAASLCFGVEANPPTIATEDGYLFVGYDVRGNVDSLTDPLSNNTSYGYDLADRLTSLSEPEATSTSYGYDAEHIASPMWRSLAREGAFNMIRDEQTKLWRSVRPDPDNPVKLDPYDAAYREKWREAPPLLPERWYKNHVAWEDRGKDIPRHVTIPKTGWKILFRSSKGDAVRGIQINLWQFDEEIKNYQFLPEALRGCMRFDGVGFWTATPQSGGVQLYELHERALSEDKDVEAFPLYIYENPFYTDESKQAFYDSLSEDERRVRWHGEYALVGAGSVVTTDIPAGTVAYGNPARVVGRVEDLVCTNGLRDKPYSHLTGRLEENSYTTR